jgi:hypothetical protein
MEELFFEGINRIKVPQRDRKYPEFQNAWKANFREVLADAVHGLRPQVSARLIFRILDQSGLAGGPVDQ